MILPPHFFFHPKAGKAGSLAMLELLGTDVTPEDKSFRWDLSALSLLCWEHTYLTWITWSHSLPLARAPQQELLFSNSENNNRKRCPIINIQLPQQQNTGMCLYQLSVTVQDKNENTKGLELGILLQCLERCWELHPHLPRINGFSVEILLCPWDGSHW